MKKVTRLLCAFALIATAATVKAQITGFGDITTWVGSGANQSAMVIQWNDGKSPHALAWGYRWDASVPALAANNMLLDIMAANVGLFARGDSSTGFGASYYGFGYDANHDGLFGVTGAVDTSGAATTPVFTNGFSNMDTDPATTQAPTTSLAAAPSDSADRYQEGWNDNGFWELFTSNIGAAYPTTWTSSSVGTGELLANNEWFAFSFSNPDFTSNLPGSAFAAIPEPASVWLLFAAGGFFIGLLRYKRRLSRR